MGKVRIDRLGALYLMIALLCAELFTPQARMLAYDAGAAAWLVALLGGLLALASIWPLHALLRRFPSQSLADISKHVLGRAAGTAVTLTYSLFFVVICGMLLREFAMTFSMTMMPKTPPSAILLVFVGVVLFAAYRGIETLARMAAYLFPVLIALYALTIVGTLPKISPTQLLPFWGLGVTNTLALSLPELSMFSEAVGMGVLAALLPPRETKQVGWRSLAISIGVHVLTYTWLAMMFPYPMGSRLALPQFEQTRMVEAGEFFQRFESLFIFLWFFVAAFKLSLALSNAAIFFGEAAGLPDYRPLLFPLALMSYATAFVPQNELQAVWLNTTVRDWSWSVGFLLPTVSLAAAALRGKRGGAGAQQAAT